MDTSRRESRISCSFRPLGALILLGATALGAGYARGDAPAASGTAAPVKLVEMTTPPGAPDRPPTVKQNVKGLAKEATDPGTLKRIKAHEQTLEKKIIRIRDQQRQDHAPKPIHDTVDVVKRLDQPERAPSPPPAAAGAGPLQPAKVTEPVKPAVAAPRAPAPAAAATPATGAQAK